MAGAAMLPLQCTIVGQLAHAFTACCADLSTGNITDAVEQCSAQVKSWTYTSKTRVLRAAARAARESGVRVRELAPEELTDELRAKLLHDVTGAQHGKTALQLAGI
jgi:hypothetical protein